MVALEGGARFSGDTEQLPAIKLRNQVAWINEHILLPFKLEVNQPSDMAFFLSLNSKASTDYKLGARLMHGRSSKLGQVVLRDDEGRAYRDLNAKGTGLVQDFSHTDEGDASVRAAQWIRTSRHGVRGLISKNEALSDAEMSEKLTKMGVRTHRVAAIIELLELPVGDAIRSTWVREMIGRVLPLDTTLPPNFSPAIEIRLFGTDVRISDTTDAIGRGDQEYMRGAFADAMELVAKECGKASVSPEEYLEWFASTLGQSLGRMHGNGYVHGNLHSQNVTLDCVITDLDTVTHIIDQDFPSVAFAQDTDDALASLSACAAALEKSQETGIRYDSSHLSALYMQAYEREKKGLEAA